MKQLFCPVRVSDGVVIGEPIVGVPEAADAEVEYWPIDFSLPSFDPAYQRVSASYLVMTNAELRRCFAEYEAEDIPLEEIKQGRKAAATELRWRKEIGGITIGGMTIRTDRESQALINGAYSLARDMLAGDVAETPIEFKGASGWTQIAPAEMVAIGRAVAAHVQACFARERALHDDIDGAATTADVLAVDINSGWPGVSE